MIPGRDHPEETWLVIAALGSGGHGTDLDETEPHGAEGIDALSIFIQTGGQPHRIGKIKPHDGDGAFGQRVAEETIKRGTKKAGQIFDGEIVSLLRIEFEQEMPGEWVQHACSLKKAPATGRGFWGYAEVRQFNWSRFNSRKATENLANS